MRKNSLRFPENKVVHLQEKYSQIYKKSIYYAIYLDKYTYWKYATTFNISETGFRTVI